MDESAQSSPVPARSIRSFFKAPNIDQLLKDESFESARDPLPDEMEKNSENNTASLKMGESTLAPLTKEEAFPVTPRKGFNANDLAVRSKFTSFFCKPRPVKSSKSPKTCLDQHDVSPLKTEEIFVATASPPPQQALVEIYIDADDHEPGLKLSAASPSDSVVCVEVLTTKRPAPAPTLPVKQQKSMTQPSATKPITPPKPSSSSMDLSQMDPILQAAFLNRQALNKAASASSTDKANVEHSTILFKIVPRVDPPRANPLFIRTRIDDTFNMLKSKIAKELHFPYEILVLVYDGVALFDSSKPSTLNLLGTKDKVNDKEKAIEMLLFTKSTWHLEQRLRDQQRKAFMENAQFLHQPAPTGSLVDEESATSDTDAYLSQTAQSLQADTLSISIRTNKTGLQVFAVQVPKSGKVFDIVERFKSVRDLGFPAIDVKVKFDGDLLPLSTEIGSVLENEDMVDLTF
jgi:hypothetical protein